MGSITNHKIALDAAGRQTLRFGQINYVNCLPLTRSLSGWQPEALNFDFVMGTPGSLNRMYQLGNLDAGAMSSFFYLQNRQFELIPNISISSLGPVGSVLFFANCEPASMSLDTIAVTSASATAVNLLKLLFLEEYGFAPQFVAADNPIINELYKGSLVIGDAAMAIDCQWSARYQRLDLGEWWHRLFQLPMVFGVWAAQRYWAESYPHLFRQLAFDLHALIHKGLTIEFDSVLQEAVIATGLPKERLAKYFCQELNYEFTDRHRDGLELYLALCRKHKLL